MKRIFSIIIVILVTLIISGCDYYPWTPSTGTTTSDKIYLDPAIGDTRILLQLNDSVRYINYGSASIDGGPTFDSGKSISQIKSEIFMHNEYTLSDIRTNTLLIQIPNTSININHFYIITSQAYSGGRTYYIMESKVIFQGEEDLKYILFPIYLLNMSIPLDSSENSFNENQNYDLMESDIDDFIEFYETIDAFNFTYTENSISITGMKNTNYKKSDRLIASFILTFEEGKVSIDV